MLQLLRKLERYAAVTVFAAAVSLYLVLTLPAALTTQSVHLNLEPYPDGLLYAVSARNAALGRGLQLEYLQSELALWVPPLYAVILIPGYLLSTAPQTFYVTNVLLGVATIFLLWRILKHRTNTWQLIGIGLLLYLSHAYCIWLPAVPMSENLVQPLFLLALSALLEKKPSPQNLLLSLIGIAGLLFTKYSLVGVVAMLSCWWLHTVLCTQSKKVKLWLLSGICLTLVAFVLYLYSIKTNPVLLLSAVLKQFTTEGGFYGTQYILSNAISYGKVLTGQSSWLLWLQHPFTSVAVAFTALGALILNAVAGRDDSTGKWLLAVFLAQFPLLLIFYVADARYVLVSLLILVVALCQVLYFYQDKLWKYKKILLCIVTLLLAIHFYSQGPLFKQVLSSNLLHRSTAWQYEAVQHFNTFFSTKHSSEPILITTLPPFFVDAYQAAEFRVVPLSNDQEFLAKGEYVWGDDINYMNLRQTYRDWIIQGKDVYITNSYITHQQAVVGEYEWYAQNFQMIEVSSGCQQACNIYKLEVIE